MLEADGSLYATIGGTPAVVTTVAAIIVTIVVSRYYANKGRSTKALGWTPLGITRIVTRPVTDVSKGLALTWNGDPLATPFTVRVRIANVGTREVIGGGSDYLEPLVVEFEDSITCYEASITKTSERLPYQVPMSMLSAPASRFEVPMPTLNMSSWIELEMIADGEIGYPKVSCVLVGETQPIAPVAGRQRSRIRSAMLPVGGLGLFVLNVGFALLGWQSFTIPEGPTLWPAVLMLIGGITLVGAGVIYIGSWYLDRQDWETAKRAAPNVFQSAH